jgi:hypothetical protein
MEEPMTDFEVRAKALELAISIYDHHLDIIQAKPLADDYNPQINPIPRGTEDILILFRLAEAIIPFLKGELEKDLEKLPKL